MIKATAERLRLGALGMAAVTGCVIVAAVLGWLRGEREFWLAPPVSSELDKFRLMPNEISGAPPEVYFALGKPYESDSFDLSQGKRLYSWFGCASCHGDGRGAAGPSFLDGWWLYGPEMVSVVASIRDGRPHGMPPFREKMTSDEIWQLAGYVRTIGAYSVQTTAPSRNDDKHTRPSENRGPAVILFQPGPIGVRVDQGPSP
jgi:cytochrome c oxidase cbb3-type subunit 3